MEYGHNLSISREQWIRDYPVPEFRSAQHFGQWFWRFKVALKVRDFKEREASKRSGYSL